MLSILVMSKRLGDFKGLFRTQSNICDGAFSREKLMAKSGSKYTCRFGATELFNCMRKMTRKI